jgi:dihydroneopterin aldolase
MGKIRLEGMAFYAYHGLYEAEARNGNEFRVDVELVTPLEAAGLADDVSLSLDYALVYELVKTQMRVRRGSLEAVVTHILADIKAQYPQVETCSVRVAKLNPPFSGPCASASVEMSWTR